MPEFTVRPASLEDVKAIHGLLMELAVYEKIDHLVEATTDSTHKALFGSSPVADALVVELSGALIATAVYFQNYSTFMGRPGLYLEDIYVQPTHRGTGIGRALLIELAKIASSRGCGRMEWTVLDWNTRAIDFYQRLGAQILPDWHLVRLSRAGIKQLAGQ
ncbi:MAG: GNAT family N-acetyltransferase [Verrucomicrobiales bacterium]